MTIIHKFAKWWKKVSELIIDTLVPEHTKIQKLLTIDSTTLYNLLPKSQTQVKDLVVLFNYENQIVRSIVKSIKLKNNQSLRQRIAQYLTDELVEMVSEINLFEGRPPILIPMPMSKKEKRQKGFNQCAEICQEIEAMKINNLRFEYHLLKKVRETKRQTTLGRTDRLLNVQNSMQANSALAKNQTIIVLDDVYTTLASFSEARRALLSASARRVIGLFIAH
jgi:ComF family protein